MRLDLYIFIQALVFISRLSFILRALSDAVYNKQDDFAMSLGMIVKWI